MSYHFEPINVLDTSNSTGLGSGGSMNIGGGISIGRDTFIGGNLSISGTATSFSDNILLINQNPQSSSDTGILFERYTSDIQNNQNYSSLIYKEAEDEFVFGYMQNNVHKEVTSFSGYTGLKANYLNLTSTENSSFTNGGALIVSGGVTISKDTYINGKMTLNDTLTFNTTGNNKSSIEFDSSQYLFIGNNKSHLQINGNDTENNPGHIELAYNTYLSIIHKLNNGNTEIEIARLSSSGNVGIGTTSPNYHLDVFSRINVTPPNLNSGGTNYASSGDSTYIQSGIGQTSGNRANLYFSSLGAGVISMVLNTAGNIGIGTESPSSIMTVNNSTTNSSNIAIRIQALPNVQSSSPQTYRIVYGNGSGNDITSSIDFGRENANQNQNQYISFRTYEGGSSGSDLSIERMRIGANGNVGIGTSSPGYRLDVNGTFRANGISLGIQGGQNGGVGRGLYWFQADDNNWVSYLSQSGAGKSPAGTSAPAGGGFSGYAIRNRVFADSTAGFIWENTNGVLLASIRANDGFTYISGNVGIGVSPVASKLEIAGTNRTSHFSFGSDEHTYIRGGKTNSHVLINDNGGLVGIGTTSPTANLDVVGTIKSRGIYTHTASVSNISNASNTTVSLLPTPNQANNGTYLVSVNGVGGGFVNVSGLAMVTLYFDGGSSYFANISSISALNFTWSSISNQGTITFQQTSGHNGVTCSFNAIKLA